MTNARLSPEEHEARARRWAMGYAPFLTNPFVTPPSTLSRGPAYDDVPLAVLLYAVACAVLPPGLVRTGVRGLLRWVRRVLRGEGRRRRP